MELLVAQCTDVETLLALARRETVAAESNDFRELIAVVEERATLGERLESYHRQIADLRALMGGTAEPSGQSAVANETIRLAVEIQTLDTKTTALLTAARTHTRLEISQLDQGRRRSVAYLSDARASGFNCDRRA